MLWRGLRLSCAKVFNFLFAAVFLDCLFCISLLFFQELPNYLHSWPASLPWTGLIISPKCWSSHRLKGLGLWWGSESPSSFPEADPFAKSPIQTLHVFLVMRNLASVVYASLSFLAKYTKCRVPEMYQFPLHFPFQGKGRGRIRYQKSSFPGGNWGIFRSRSKNQLRSKQAKMVMIAGSVGRCIPKAWVVLEKDELARAPLH